MRCFAIASCLFSAGVHISSHDSVGTYSWVSRPSARRAAISHIIRLSFPSRSSSCSSEKDLPLTLRPCRSRDTLRSYQWPGTDLLFPLSIWNSSRPRLIYSPGLLSHISLYFPSLISAVSLLLPLSSAFIIVLRPVCYICSCLRHEMS